jgi:AcrR family transcriptional regulator
MNPSRGAALAKKAQSTLKAGVAGKAKPSRTHRVRRGPVSPAQAAARRDLMIRVATEEFLAKGFEGANLAHIAKRSRVSKMTIYDIFPSKESLFREILANIIARFRFDLDHVLHTDRPFDVVIRDVLELLAASSRDQSVSAVLGLAIAERNRFRVIGRMLLDQTYDLLKPLAEYLKANGSKSMGEEVAMEMAFLLMIMAYRGHAFLLVDMSIHYNKRWIDSAAQIFLDGFPRRRTRGD